MTLLGPLFIASLALLAQPAPPASEPAAPPPATTTAPTDTTSQPPAAAPAAPAPAPATAPAPAAEPAPAPQPEAAAPQPAAATPSEKPRLYVAPVTGFGIPADLIQVINEAVSTEAGQSPSHQTLTEADLAQLLNVEQRKQMAGCSDPSCFTDLGKLTNADRVLSCSAGLLGEDVNISCKLLGVREGATLASKDRKVINKPSAAAEAARALVGILLDGQPRERRGLVELKVNQAGAEVFLDGRSLGQSPVAEPVRVDEGKREIVIKKGGYATWRTTLDVQAGTFTTVDAELIATRSLQLWPVGIAAGLVGTALFGVAMLAGVGAGATADCLYYGSLRQELPGNPLAASSAVCNAAVNTGGGREFRPFPIPPYKVRPIDNYQFAERESQVIAASLVANILFGSAAAVLVLGGGSAVALIVTDLIIRVVRREE